MSGKVKKWPARSVSKDSKRQEEVKASIYSETSDE